MEISVQFRSVYGNLLCYPMDAKAQAFARIANNKTLTRNTLRNILALGFRINAIDRFGRVSESFTFTRSDNLPAVA
jgi:hypothetical protein